MVTTMPTVADRKDDDPEQQPACKEGCQVSEHGSGLK